MKHLDFDDNTVLVLIGDNGFYLGASYDWFTGSAVKEDFLGFEITSTSNAWSAGLDLGYSIWIGPFITSYILNVGYIHMDLDRGRGNQPRGTVKMSPVFSVLYPIDWFVVGVEAYFSFIPSGTIPSAVVLNVPIGVRF